MILQYSIFWKYEAKATRYTFPSDLSTSAFTQDGASSVFADLGHEESETRASTEKGTKGNL